MSQTQSLLAELERAVSQGSERTRRAALIYTTDLLMAGRYTEEETWVFGEVVGLLAAEIETGARAELAQRLAVLPHMPSNIVCKLASDDAIEVAGPVLRHSERLGVSDLVAHAKAKSQAHLLAIAQRKSLHEDVTDVLVARGDRDVVHSVAKNPGAKFSDSGFWRLVQRSEDDIVLMLEVGGRRDISRHHFQKLISKASDEARVRLAAINPRAASAIEGAVAHVTGEIHAKFGPGSKSYYEAKREVGKLYRAGEINDRTICELARLNRFEEVVAALSLLCDLPVDVVERALLDDDAEMIMILTKAAKLSWTTTRALLSACHGARMSEQDMEQALKNFSSISAATAQHVLTFYRARASRSDTADVATVRASMR
jgi:uncharacterized protein (DUF2336 family)